jgi:hypothetical protein
MSASRGSEPSTDELLAFAAELLSRNGDVYGRDPEFIADTVREARDLWVLLYDVANDVIRDGDGP